jgi:hypothetical protein
VPKGLRGLRASCQKAFYRFCKGLDFHELGFLRGWAQGIDISAEGADARGSGRADLLSGRGGYPLLHPKNPQNSMENASKSIPKGPGPGSLLTGRFGQLNN